MPVMGGNHDRRAGIPPKPHGFRHQRIAMVIQILLWFIQKHQGCPAGNDIGQGYLRALPP